jgi:hypothetical protein
MLKTDQGTNSRGGKTTTEQCAKTHEEIEDMTRVPYASAVNIMVAAGGIYLHV